MKPSEKNVVKDKSQSNFNLITLLIFTIHQMFGKGNQFQREADDSAKKVKKEVQFHPGSTVNKKMNTKRITTFNRKAKVESNTTKTLFTQQ